ncbi:MAG: hypothetical protein V4474_03280 [Patescibacteria group bacterium]
MDMLNMAVAALANGVAHGTVITIKGAITHWPMVVGGFYALMVADYFSPATAKSSS